MARPGRRNRFPDSASSLTDANDYSSLLSTKRSTRGSWNLSNLREIEDRRLFNPDPARAPKGLRTWVVPVVAKPPKAAPTAKPAVRPKVTRLAFKSPLGVAICVRRKIRRSVIHALGKAGKGSKRPRRRNAWSDVRC